MGERVIDAGSGGGTRCEWGKTAGRGAGDGGVLGGAKGPLVLELGVTPDVGGGREAWGEGGGLV